MAHRPVPGRLGKLPRLMGLVVVSSFLLGLVSAPVRPCVSHPGHASEAHGGHAPAPESHAAPQHHDQVDLDPDGSPTQGPGCDCLGLCQVEHSPVLSVATFVAPEFEPAASDGLRRVAPLAPPVELTYPVPLARPPPQDT